MTLINKTPKRERTRLARSEIWRHLAVTTQKWADEISALNPTVRPFAEWPNGEPFKIMMKTYGLDQADLVRMLTSVGQQLENKALKTGYNEAWLDYEEWA